LFALGLFVPAKAGKAYFMGDKYQASRSDDATREEERREARAGHVADRPPTTEEDRAAPGRRDLAPGVKEHFDEMAERGASQKGEGKVP
jgi:hypothetical protein